MNPAARHDYLWALGLETWVARGKSIPAGAPRDAPEPREAAVPAE